jgi:hypothetical protein
MAKSLNVLLHEQEEGQLPFRMDTSSIPSEYYSAIQNWVLCFLTRKGSRKLDPEYGSRFLQRLDGGHLYTEGDVAREFSDANATALSYCRAPDGLFVKDAKILFVDTQSLSAGRSLIIHIYFLMSDGSSTKTNLEVL